MERPVPKLVKEVEFETVELKPSRYWLENGDVLRLLRVPLKVWLTDRMNPDGVPVIGIAWQNVDTAVTPEDKKGKPSDTIPSPEERAKFKTVEVDWKKSEEPFSRFLFDDMYIAKAKPILTRALLFENQYDIVGDRVYNLRSDITLTIYPKKAQ